MIRRPPRSTLDRSSAASDVYKRQTDDLLAELLRVQAMIVPAQLEQFAVRAHLLDAPVLDDQNARGVADSRETVSYTHLRAHETVLDLVCRLLLEKKKSQATASLLSPRSLEHDRVSDEPSQQ